MRRRRRRVTPNSKYCCNIYKYKNTKSQNYTIYKKLQNMNYGSYIYILQNTKIEYFLFVFVFFSFSSVFQMLENISLFRISDSDSLYWTLYGNMAKKYFSTFSRTFSKNVPEV